MSIFSFNTRQLFGYIEKLATSITPFNRIFFIKEGKVNFLFLVIFIILILLLFEIDFTPYIKEPIINSDPDLTILGSSSTRSILIEVFRVVFSIFSFVLIIQSFLIEIIDGICGDLSNFSYSDKQNSEKANLKTSVFLLINGYFFRIILFSLIGLLGLISINNITIFKFGISAFSQMKYYGSLENIFHILRQTFEHPFSAFYFDSAGCFWATCFKFSYNTSRIVISILLPGSLFFILTSFKSEYEKK